MNLAGCSNILFKRNFTYEIIEVECSRLFQVVCNLQHLRVSDYIQVFNEMFVSCLNTVLSPLKFLGPERAISSFSEYILCAKASFHLRKSQWQSGKLHQSWLCDLGSESSALEGWGGEMGHPIAGPRTLLSKLLHVKKPYCRLWSDSWTDPGYNWILPVLAQESVN